MTTAPVHEYLRNVHDLVVSKGVLIRDPKRRPCFSSGLLSSTRLLLLYIILIRVTAIVFTSGGLFSLFELSFSVVSTLSEYKLLNKNTHFRVIYECLRGGVKFMKCFFSSDNHSR